MLRFGIKRWLSSSSKPVNRKVTNPNHPEPHELTTMPSILDI
jgi:hypothetical protein